MTDRRAKETSQVDTCDYCVGFFDGDWSPSGTRVTFTGYEVDRSVSTIWWMAVAGSGRFRFHSVYNRNTHVFAPAWSPSGRRIAFIESLADGSTQIVTMQRDGTHVRRIEVRGLHAASLDWSSQGRLVFGSAHLDPRHDELYTIRPDGTALRRLTRNQARDRDPDWAPMGHRVAYVHGNTIWTMRADGSHKHSVGVRGSSPTWAPNGTLIAYLSRSDGAIHTVAPDGSRDRTLGNPFSPGHLSGLDWRPRH